MPEAKVLSNTIPQVQHATVGQPGAKVVSMPVAVSHSSPLGAKQVSSGVAPARGNATTTSGSATASQIAPGTSSAQVIQRPQNMQTPVQPRPGVAKRPHNGRQGAPSRVVAMPAPAPAPVTTPIAPFDVEKCMFLNHLVDAFFAVQANQADQPVNEDMLRVATETQAAVQSWMVALSNGSAVAPAADAIPAPVPASVDVTTGAEQAQ